MSSTKARSSRPASKVLAVAFLFNIFAFCAFGQSVVWTGFATCTATAIGPYTDNNGFTGTFSYTETQTWAMTGGAPTPAPPFASYPGIYTVTGSGFKQVSGGANLSYSTSYSTARALLVGQLSGGRWQVVPAQLTGSTAGTQIGSDTMIYSIVELSFPAPISTAIPNQGSSTPTPPPNIVAQQPSGVPMTVSCNWYFGPPHPPFFAGEVSLGSGVYSLQFPDGNSFGYYNFPSSSILYHYDMGFEAYVPGTGTADIYLYDFTAGHWFYTSAALFPYLYDFTLNNWLYYFPDSKNPGHYTTNPRYFSNLTTGMISTM